MVTQIENMNLGMFKYLNQKERDQAEIRRQQ